MPSYQSFTGWGRFTMPFEMYERMIGAVPSGRSVSFSAPVVSNEYISFSTMSVWRPMPRTNSAVSSTAGVSMRSNPYAVATSLHFVRNISQNGWSCGRMSRIPRGGMIGCGGFLAGIVGCAAFGAGFFNGIGSESMGRETLRMDERRDVKGPHSSGGPA